MRESSTAPGVTCGGGGLLRQDNGRPSVQCNPVTHSASERDPERWRRLNDLFHAALDLGGTERRSFLEASCAGDDDLRSEIERLLDAHARAEDFLATATRPDEGSGSVDAEPSAAGRRVGPYVLVREVGRGGMGTVYLAERADQQYEKRVAIKLIKRGMDTEALLKRHGFRLVSPGEKDRLLQTYWSIPVRQQGASVVLVRPRLISTFGQDQH